MWNEPALWIVVLAVVASLLSRFLPSSASETVVLPPIFVGLVSFCDGTWPRMVQQMIDTAWARDTLRIGVLEYVRTAADSLEPALPPEWRHIVRVYTVSHRIATTQRAARQLCVGELYRKEPYVLFVRGAAMHVHWDRELIDSMPSSSAIISTHVNRRDAACFPCFVDGVVRQREPVNVTAATGKLLPSLVAQTELIFFRSPALPLVLSTSDDVVLSGTLAANGYSLFVPGIPIATYRRVRGVTRGKLKPRAKLGAEYAERNGFGARATANARLGLTPSAGSAEIIAKYGSIVSARLAIQEEEAVLKGHHPT